MKYLISIWLILVSLIADCSETTPDLLNRWTLNNVDGNIVFSETSSLLNGSFLLTLTYESIGENERLMLFWPEGLNDLEVHHPLITTQNHFKELDATELIFLDPLPSGSKVDIQVAYQMSFSRENGYLLLEKILPEVVPVNPASLNSTHYKRLVKATHSSLLSENYWKSYLLESSDLIIKVPDRYSVTTSFGDHVENTMPMLFRGREVNRFGAIILGVFEKEDISIGERTLNLFSLPDTQRTNRNINLVRELVPYYMNAMGELSYPYPEQEINVFFLPMNYDLAFQRTLLFNQRILTSSDTYEVHASISHEVVHQWLGIRSFCDTTHPAHMFILESLTEYIADYLVSIKAEDAIYSKKIETDLEWLKLESGPSLKGFNSQEPADFYVGYVSILRNLAKTNKEINLVDLVVRYSELAARPATVGVNEIVLMDIDSFSEFIREYGFDLYSELE